MAAFATSLLSILDPNNNSDPRLGLELGLGLGLGLGLNCWPEAPQGGVVGVLGPAELPPPPRPHTGGGGTLPNGGFWAPGCPLAGLLPPKGGCLPQGLPPGLAPSCVGPAGRCCQGGWQFLVLSFCPESAILWATPPV